LCDTFCEKVAACLFSFGRSRSSVFTRTATTTTWTAVFRAVTTWTTWAALFRGYGVNRHFAVRQHVALVDPDLDTDDPVRRVRFGSTVIDVSAQGVQRHTAFAVPFGTSDFDAVQATRAHDLDALGTQTHGVLHGTLHRTTEHDALFQLLGNGIGDQLSVGRSEERRVGKEWRRA